MPPEPNPSLTELTVLDGGGGESPEVKKQARKRWDMAESRIVAIELARQCRKQGFRRVPTDRVGRKFVAEFLATAQLKLPRDRRRLGYPLQAYNLVFWKLVEDELTNPTLEVTTPAATPSAPPPPASEPQGTGAPPAEKVGPPEGHMILPAVNPFANVPLEVLLTAAMQKIAQTVTSTQAKVSEIETFCQLVTEQIGAVERQREELTRRLSVTEVELKNLHMSRQLRPKVGIVGCQQSYFDHVKTAASEAGLKLNLRLYEQTANPSPIHDDWAVVTKWSSHKWSDQVQAAIPNGQWVSSTAGPLVLWNN